MKEGFKAIGLVGAVMLTLAFSGKEDSNYTRYKTNMVVEQLNPYLMITYENPKSRRIYKRVKEFGNSKGLYELLSIQEDLNNNNLFDENETIYENFELLKDKEQEKEKTKTVLA